MAIHVPVALLPTPYPRSAFAVPGKAAAAAGAAMPAAGIVQLRKLNLFK